MKRIILIALLTAAAVNLNAQKVNADSLKKQLNCFEIIHFIFLMN